ncbi:RNA 2',3'-cyclic phosphodiesterase [Bacillaceae bacterium IKA-2]|nr:RNA 2',3'-cyclic phosphodiesterase [Bacillaceae bacterium IKA-2]
MTKQSHYFIAVPIDERLKEKLANWNKNQNPPFKQFIDEADYHITLVFLGGVEPSLFKGLKNSLAEISIDHARFSLILNGIGFFGQEKDPRIFWAGVKKEEKLFRLQKAIFETCTKLGFHLDVRPYTPHLTMARKYSGDIPYLNEKLKLSFQKALKEHSWNVSRFVIYQTHLNQTPKYEEIASFSLGKK